MVKNVIEVATSGIDATLLLGGRTAHSRFQIPLRPTTSTLCKIIKQTELAYLIRRASAIELDEAPIANRYAFESVSESLQCYRLLNEGQRQNKLLQIFQDSVIIPWEGEQSIQMLIDSIFPSMINHVNDENYMVDKAIILPKNVHVDNINQMIILKFHAEKKDYGQLYVAFLRGVPQNSTKILVKDGNLERQSGVLTGNMVFKVILLSNRE
ncbi:uncharacterized protein LOC142526194 [Primulina tabacum]|uniref:uncharacterized protein LOC142526194 n=1 Tax=Primulina tabacum TaxID=48773 RepID=UPI003F5A020F